MINKLHHSSLNRIPRPKRTTRLHQRLKSNTNDQDNNIDTNSNQETQSDKSSTSSSYQPSHSSSCDESIPISPTLKLSSCKKYYSPNKSNQTIIHNHLRLTFTTSIYKQITAHSSTSRSCSRKSILTSSPYTKTKTYHQPYADRIHVMSIYHLSLPPLTLHDIPQTPSIIPSRIIKKRLPITLLQPKRKT